MIKYLFNLDNIMKNSWKGEILIKMEGEFLFLIKFNSIYKKLKRMIKWIAL